MRSIPSCVKDVSPFSGRRSEKLFKIALGVSALLLDQLSKLLVLKKLPYGYSLPIIPGFLYITPTENKGIAFGAFSYLDSLFLSLISLAVVALLLYFWHQHSPYLYLIIGGALGNIVDRVRLGYVLDFINIHYWPVFNVADICIFLGVILTIISVAFKKGGEENISYTI